MKARYRKARCYGIEERIAKQQAAAAALHVGNRFIKQGPGGIKALKKMQHVVCVCVHSCSVILEAKNKYIGLPRWLKRR